MERTLRIKVANFFARNSCKAWQPIGILRKICRRCYQSIMESGNDKNYPYADKSFADWPESDDKYNYTLVTDSAGFVIRHSPSYIAWMIKQKTGRWLKRPTPGPRTPGEHAFDAKHWDEILEYNGWQKCILPVTINDKGKSHISYVGIIKDEGEYGQLLWLDDADIEYYDSVLGIGRVKSWGVSTYKNFQLEYRIIPVSNHSGIIWYCKMTTT